MNCTKCQHTELKQEFTNKLSAFSRDSKWFVGCKFTNENVEYCVENGKTHKNCPFKNRED